MGFNDCFDEPLHFSDGSYYLSAELYTQEQAAKIFSESEGVELEAEHLKSDRVRFQFPPYEVAAEMETRDPVWVGGASGRGSKPVWVYDPYPSPATREEGK
jgi:hypothetical protein